MLEINRSNPWHGRCNCLLMRHMNKPPNKNCRTLLERAEYENSKMLHSTGGCDVAAACGLQTVNPSTAAQANAPATLPSSADEVVRLTQSGVGDQVVLAF